jgi:hypothetical protein
MHEEQLTSPDEERIDLGYTRELFAEAQRILARIPRVCFTEGMLARPLSRIVLCRAPGCGALFLRIRRQLYCSSVCRISTVGAIYYAKNRERIRGQRARTKAAAVTKRDAARSQSVADVDESAYRDGQAIIRDTVEPASPEMHRDE